MAKPVSRRRVLLQLLELGAAGSAGALLVAGCRRDPRGACNDLSGLGDADRATRHVVNYRASTTRQDRRCDNCALWLAGGGLSKCGSCKVVKGPIHANGYCDSWQSS